MSEPTQQDTAHHLDEEASALLRDTIGDEASAITLHIGDGHEGRGLYVSLTEYPEEGAIHLAAAQAPTGQQAERPAPIGTSDYWHKIADERAAEIVRLNGLMPAPAGQAVGDVIAERERQKTVEGWTPEHDDAHDDGSMAAAAACYAMHSAIDAGIRSGRLERYSDPVARFDKFVPDYWPWDGKWWKPKASRRNLVKAGALILAEIERLDRAASQAERPAPAEQAAERVRAFLDTLSKSHPLVNKEVIIEMNGHTLLVSDLHALAQP